MKENLEKTKDKWFLAAPKQPKPVTAIRYTDNNKEYLIDVLLRTACECNLPRLIQEEGDTLIVDDESMWGNATHTVEVGDYIVLTNHSPYMSVMTEEKFLHFYDPILQEEWL